MKGYDNLTVTIDPEKAPEVRYNFITGEAVIIATDDESVRRGMEDSRKRGILDEITKHEEVASV